MFGGIAVAYSDLPVELIDQHRVHERGGEPEVQFLVRDADRVLPVWQEGRLRIIRWGNRRGQSRVLPCTAWTWAATLEQGGWGEREAVPVVIPATMGLDRGVWFRVREGIRGVVVQDEQGRPVVYVLVEPATHYYQVMTRSSLMPVLVGS
jgi:hypothetical protein